MRITRRRTMCVTLAVCLALYAGPVAAQTTPAQTFEDLRPRLEAGDSLILRDDSGRMTRGRLLSLTGDEIEVESVRWFRLRQQSFAEGSIRRIEIQDSTWNGGLIGLAVGAIGMVVIVQTCKKLACLLPFILSPAVGFSVGVVVDQSMNETVYAPPASSAAGRSRQNGLHLVGLTARIRF